MTTTQNNSRSTLYFARLFMISAAFLGTSAFGQTQPSPPPPPLSTFARLFPRYTGLNGYEDLVIASDLVHDKANDLSNAAQEPTATLKQMRAALADPNIARALALVRTALDKPLESPRDAAKLDEDTIFPELAQFRNLARLIAIEEHVALADGQISRAIDAMRDGLRLGYIVQAETLIGGLVGIAIDAVVLERFAAHFDQMALRDCAHITALAQEWLALTPRPELVLTAEHRTLHNMLDAWKSDPERLKKMVKMMQPKAPPESESDIAAIELQDYLSTNGAAAAAMLDQVSAIADREHATLIAEIRKPAWQRKPPSKLEPRSDMAHRMYSLVSSTFTLAFDKFDLESAKIHLLGVHGAIRRFRWENSRLPSSLAELKQPALTTDPFTGAPLIYKITGGRYELSSAGPTSSATSAGTGNLGPIFLPRN